MTIPNASTPVSAVSMVPLQQIPKPKGNSNRSKKSGRGFDILEVTQLSEETWNEIKASIDYAFDAYSYL